MLSQLNYLLRLNLVPPTEPIVEAEELPEETPNNAGKRIKAVLYSALGLAIVGSAIL